MANYFVSFVRRTKVGSDAAVVTPDEPPASVHRFELIELILFLADYIYIYLV